MDGTAVACLKLVFQLSKGFPIMLFHKSPPIETLFILERCSSYVICDMCELMKRIFLSVTFWHNWKYKVLGKFTHVHEEIEQKNLFKQYCTNFHRTDRRDLFWLNV